MSMSSDLPVCVDEYYDDDDTIYCDCCGEVEVGYYGQECENCRYGNEDLEDPDSWCEGVHYYDKDVLEFHNYQFPKNQKLMLMGIELEHEYSVYDRSEFQSVVNNIYRYFKSRGCQVIVKDDVSLVRGAELVTVPYTLREHKEHFKQYWSTITELNNNYDKAGMHVHVSKKAVTKFTINKLVAFINDACNRIFLIKLAGRESTVYAAFGNSYSLYEKYWCNNRSSALNYRRNSDTVEFRLYDSPLNYYDFCVRLEFTEALLIFLSNVSYTQLNYKDFIDWLRKNRCKKYFHLIHWISSNY